MFGSKYQIQSIHKRGCQLARQFRADRQKIPVGFYLFSLCSRWFVIYFLKSESIISISVTILLFLPLLFNGESNDIIFETW